MRKGRVESVAVLQEGSDSSLIAEATALFEREATLLKFDGFEVWDQARLVYRYTSDGK